MPFKLPPSFKGTSAQALSGMVVERLLHMMPEAALAVAYSYLRDASLLLSLSRSYDGISASGDKELAGLFDLVLKGELPHTKAERLEAILEQAKASEPLRSCAELHSLRLKGAYHLKAASSMVRN